MKSIDPNSLYMISPFLNRKDKDNLHKLSKTISCAILPAMIQSASKDNPSIDGRKRMLIRQTLLIIKKSNFSLRKKYACLNALFSSTLSSSEPESFKLFKAIATANIPHFILTRCWEIRVDWNMGMHLTNPRYNSITIRSLSALVQAYKNVLTITQIIQERGTKDVLVPTSVLTQKNCPVVKVLSQEERQAYGEEIIDAIEARIKGEKLAIEAASE